MDGGRSIVVTCGRAAWLLTQQRGTVRLAGLAQPPAEVRSLAWTGRRVLAVGAGGGLLVYTPAR